MRRTIAACCLLLTTTFLLAQTVPLPKYKVVKLKSSQDVADINAAADRGYRLIFPGRFAIMRLDATPPDAYRYLPVPAPVGRTSLLNALNQQGALGYRLVSELGVLEKEPHPRNYEYQYADGFTGKSRDRSRDSLLAQGFHPLQMIQGDQIFIREIGGVRPVSPTAARIRVVDAMRTGNVVKGVSDLAAQGYRYQSPGTSKKGGGKAAQMEECDSTCGGPFEYRAFDVDDAAQLERDLNTLGKDGFRAVPKSLDFPPHFAERDAKHAQTFAYRTIEATDANVVEEALNAGDRDGYVPIGIAVHVGWNVHVFVVMEKATTAQAVPATSAVPVQ